MDELRERFIKNALSMYPLSHRLPLLRLVRGERPMLVMNRERPVQLSDFSGHLGKRYKVDRFMLWEHGGTWS